VFPEAAEVGRFRVASCDWNGGVECTVAGTGYTGEPGIEIAVPAEPPPICGRRSPAPASARPGSAHVTRLRLEAALPLHGHELGAGITPLQAGLGWVVAFDKPEFRGREALLDERGRGSAGACVASPRKDGAHLGPTAHVLVDDVDVGVVTSGNFSPVLAHGIALGFLPPDADVGTQLVVDVRGTPVPGRVVETPFV
jgi:aminomethyltransferase